MVRWRCSIPYFLFATIQIGPSLFLAIAQEQPAPQDNSAKPLNAKELKKRQKKLAKELGNPDQDWLENEVPDIITEAERRAFLELSTNEEREQFIEIFWDKRNPDPESPTNAFKEEHYRRLAYADEHFASGIPGRKTDRGRIYTIWGPADEIDSHPTGGTYERSPNKAAAVPPLTLGNYGAIVTWKELAKTSKLNSSIPPAQASTTSRAILAKKMLLPMFPGQGRAYRKS